MLVFEDLHWADASLLDLVEMLAARLRDVPIFLLVLARPELLDARPAWGGGLPSYTALPLEPLGGNEARELASQLLTQLPLEQLAALRFPKVSRLVLEHSRPPGFAFRGVKEAFTP